MSIFKKILLHFIEIEDLPERDLIVPPIHMAIRIDDHIAQTLLAFNTSLRNKHHLSAAQELLQLTLNVGRLDEPTYKQLRQFSLITQRYGKYVIDYLLQHWWEILCQEQLVVAESEQKACQLNSSHSNTRWLSYQNLNFAKGLIRLYSFHYQEASTEEMISFISISNRKISADKLAATPLMKDALKQLARLQLVHTALPFLERYPNCMNGIPGRFFKRYLSSHHSIRA